MTDTAPTITIDPNKLTALMRHFNECPLPPVQLGEPVPAEVTYHEAQAS